jgi:hypothetical protein
MENAPPSLTRVSFHLRAPGDREKPAWRTGRTFIPSFHWCRRVTHICRFLRKVLSA